MSEPLDGILGLCRNRNVYINPGQETDVGPLYLEEMRRQNVIDRSTVSFYFQSPGLVSFANFGEPDLSYLRTDSDLIYIDMLDDFFYSQFNQGVAIGSIDNEDYSFAFQHSHSNYDLTIVDNAVYSIIDTGSNAIYFSALYYE